MPLDFRAQNDAMTMKRHSKVLLLTASIALGLVITEPASAQTPENKAAAQAMFDKAMPLMTAGKYQEACSLLEESQRLDAGMAAQFRLAECYEKVGRLASAWTTFVEVTHAAQAAGMSERERVARERAASLKPKLSYLIIQVPEGVAANPKVQITRDGMNIGRPQWGADVPVDPGVHTIEVITPGSKPWTAQVSVELGPATTTIKVPDLAPPSVTASHSPAAMHTDQADPSPWTMQRTIGVIVGGVGLAGVVVGAVFGVRSLGNNADSDSHCTVGSPDRCDETGLELRSDARTSATVSTVAFALGGAAVAAGVVLFAAAPSGQSTTSSVSRVTVNSSAGPSTAFVLLRGDW
jgi:hypothetical protein